MRVALVLLMAALPVRADEQPDPAPSEAPAHDPFGFPITFNEEIITLSDLEREIGARLTDAGQVRNARDSVLMRLLSERVAVKLGVTVEPLELDGLMQRHVDQRGGDAKFYDWLAQRGDTLERFREQQRQEMLQHKLAYLFRHGISQDHRKLLPWRVRPTPTDLDKAYRNDKARLKAGLQVRRLELVVDLDEAERKKLATLQTMQGLSVEEVEKRTASKLDGRIEKVMEDLRGGRPFEHVARDLGADVNAQKINWVQIPKGATDPTLKFLQEAKAETFSEPIKVAGGGYRVVYLLERKKPNPKGVRDPSVAMEYEHRIRELRGRKWEAYLKLKALDDSTVRPRRVADEFRKVVVTELRAAEEGLRELGLH